MAEHRAVTIVVPVFNAEKTIARCVESLLAQTYSDFEVVLVDDGSTDSSAEIIRQFSHRDPRLRLVVQTNGGVSSARNRGMSLAQGKYLRFVDADDEVPASSLDILVRAQVSTGAEVVFGGYEEMRHGRRVAAVSSGEHATLSRREFAQSFDRLRDMKLTGYCWNTLYVTDLARSHAVRFPEDMSMGEDEIFNLAYLGRVSRVSLVPEIVYARTMNDHESSLSTNFRGDRHALERRRLDAMLDFLEDEPDVARVLGETYAMRLATQVVPYLARGSRRYGLFATRASTVREDPYYRRYADYLKPRGAIDRTLHFCLQRSLFWPLWLMGRLRNLIPG